MLLTGLMLVNLLLLVVFVMLLVKSERALRDFREFISPPSPDKPSPAAQLYSALVQDFVRMLMVSIKTTFMGVESGSVRQSKMLEGAIATDALSGSSPLGMVLASFPTVQKLLRKHPGLVDAALSSLGKRVPNNGAQPEPSVKSSLDRY